MLNQLSVKNVAVISKLDVELKNGVTVLTGETGAGKSIIIDSINMILGERTNKDIVRYGEQKAVVSAVFEDVPESVINLLEENDIDTEDSQLIISRQLTSDGKSTAKINGTPVPLSFLREIADGLINIHGQHDNQALLTPKKHIMFLDAYAGDTAAIDAYASVYKEARSLKGALAELETDEKTKEQRIDLLEYQIKEIESANLTEGEEKELKDQRELLNNAERITEALDKAYMCVYDSDDGNSAYDRLSVAVDALSGISEFDGVIQSAYDALSSAMYAAEDAAHELKEFRDTVEFDEQTLNEIEERLDTISRLKRKYGNTETEIIEYGKKAREELDGIHHSDERVAELTEKLKEKMSELKTKAAELTGIRSSAALELGKKITESLSELNMEKARLEIAVRSAGAYKPNGADEVEFMISMNPGEPLKPLAKIASGGELSRIILAIKSILADSDSVGTMIFDEIDTGVSGAAAAKITQKLKGLAKNKQVICITHLPQLAAAADNHYLIVKNTDGDLASTTLTELSTEQRETELARMTDGTEITDIALQHARQMLEGYAK